MCRTLSRHCHGTDTVTVTALTPSPTRHRHYHAQNASLGNDVEMMRGMAQPPGVDRWAPYRSLMGYPAHTPKSLAMALSFNQPELPLEYIRVPCRRVNCHLTTSVSPAGA